MEASCRFVCVVIKELDAQIILMKFDYNVSKAFSASCFIFMKKAESVLHTLIMVIIIPADR